MHISNEPQRKRHRRTAGITLIEMLVVITLIALFSAVVYQRYTPLVDEGRRTAAKTQIEAFRGALLRYNIEHGKFPTEDQGLDALRPYMTKNIPLDPWNNPYVYRHPGEHGPDPDMISYGADGEPGGEGPDSDVLSWE